MPELIWQNQLQESQYRFGWIGLKFLQDYLQEFGLITYLVIGAT